MLTSLAVHLSAMLPVDSPSLMLAPGFSLGANLIEAVAQSDAIGILCLLVLLVISVISGYHIFSKGNQLRAARNDSEAFIEECFESPKSLAEIYRSAKDYPASPLAALLCEAYLEYELEVRQPFIEKLSVEERIQFGKASIESALERTMAAQMRQLENRLVFLATASSLAPFIGLFGTVWGVLGAFQALGREGNAALTTLAPGISTALVTTVFGLIVAIPAAAFYNHLSNRVAHLGSQMDSFAHELSNVFQKHFIRRGGE